MDKPLSSFAKLLLLGAGALAIVTGPVLYLFPNDTATYFAWTIQHPLTPVFMGACYLAGIGNLIAVRADRWSLARAQMPAIITFTITMLAATLLHTPIFNWSHPIAWAWLAVYVISPVAALIVWIRMERGFQAPDIHSKELPRSFSSVMLAFALVHGVTGLALFLIPGQTAPLWPWSLTPLTARVVGGWWMSAAALEIMLARQKTLHTARVGLLANMLITSLLLIGALVHFSDFDGPQASIWLYLLFNVLFGGYSAYGWIAASRK